MRSLSTSLPTALGLIVDCLSIYQELADHDPRLAAGRASPWAIVLENLQLDVLVIMVSHLWREKNAKESQLQACPTTQAAPRVSLGFTVLQVVTLHFTRISPMVHKSQVQASSDINLSQRFTLARALNCLDATMANPGQLRALKLEDLDSKLTSCQDLSDVVKPPTMDSNLEQLRHAPVKLQDAGPRAQTDSL